MSEIKLITHINAPIDRVFDLARSIDFHLLSTAHTNEKAIAGKTSGLIELHETVTWRAKHLGFYQNLTVQITQFERPHFFEDRMLKGAFKHMKHQHHFKEHNNGCLMTDTFEFSSPFGYLGQAFDLLFLKKYMTRLLLKRNEALKAIAERAKWKGIVVQTETLS